MQNLAAHQMCQWGIHHSRGQPWMLCQHQLPKTNVCMASDKHSLHLWSVCHAGLPLSQSPLSCSPRREHTHMLQGNGHTCKFITCSGALGPDRAADVSRHGTPCTKHLVRCRHHQTYDLPQQGLRSGLESYIYTRLNLSLASKSQTLKLGCCCRRLHCRLQQHAVHGRGVRSQHQRLGCLARHAHPPG